MSETASLVVPLRRDSGGTFRVGATRVPLDTVVHAFNEGATPEEIVQRYSTLRLADVYAVISYYLHNRAEVEAYLRRREQEAENLRRKIEADFAPHGIRERLLARRAEARSAPAAPCEPHE
ncbi:MAG: DUF433 domain-containing protein [Chloroflexi bacterium]|nr:DUF433 domain-containing protein [Chloroflexota bacterium]